MKRLLVCLIFVSAAFAALGATRLEQRVGLAIKSFTANPASIEAGQSATLSWETVNATSATLGIYPYYSTFRIHKDYAPDPVPVNGSMVVSPAETTTYYLIARHRRFDLNKNGKSDGRRRGVSDGNGGPCARPRAAYASTTGPRAPDATGPSTADSAHPAYSYARLQSVGRRHRLSLWRGRPTLRRVTRPRARSLLGEPERLLAAFKR